MKTVPRRWASQLRRATSTVWNRQLRGQLARAISETRPDCPSPAQQCDATPLSLLTYILSLGLSTIWTGNQLTNYTILLCMFDDWRLAAFTIAWQSFTGADDGHKLRPQLSSYPLNDQPDGMIATWFTAQLRFSGTLYYLLFIFWTNSAIRCCCCWVDRCSDFIMLTWAWWCCNCLPPDLINDADLFSSTRMQRAVLASYTLSLLYVARVFCVFPALKCG